MDKKLSKAILVGIYPQGTETECEKSLDELKRLAETAGASVFAYMTQMKNTPETATCIGSGKLEELAVLCENNEIDTVIFDCELTPAQIKNIENEVKCDVIDRSMLIFLLCTHQVQKEKFKLSWLS